MRKKALGLDEKSIGHDCRDNKGLGTIEYE